MSILDLLEKKVNTYFAAVPRKPPSAGVIENACIIAHRGAHSLDLIENTEAAFSRARALGCFGIELDIHATADGVLVVNHDPTLHRLWNKGEKINSLTFMQLRTLVPEISSLEEIIGFYQHQLHFFIEIKAPFTHYAELQKTLSALTPVHEYHLLTLDAQIATELVAFPREAILLVANYNNTNHFCNLSLEKNYGGVLGHYLLLSQTKINKLKKAGQKVGVGFVDSKNSLYRELNRGVNWLFSNKVDAIK